MTDLEIRFCLGCGIAGIPMPFFFAGDKPLAHRLFRQHIRHFTSTDQVAFSSLIDFECRKRGNMQCSRYA